MKKVILFILVVSYIFFTFTSPIFAFTAKSGETVNLTENESDDVYAVGSNVNVSSEINGDLVAAGGRLNLNGMVAQDLIAAGGFIDVGGEVKDDARIAGGNITINGLVSDDVVVAGGQVLIDKGAKIGGDLVVGGGSIIINGDVSGKIIASGGDIEISGKAGNGVEIGGAGSLTIGSTADITGDLIYSSGQEAKISEEAKISGSIKFTEIKEPKKVEKSLFAVPFGIFGGIFGATYIGSQVASFLSMFVIGIILILAIPSVFKKFNSRMKSSFGLCVGGGAIMLFGIPIGMAILCFIGVLLLFTIVGAGLGILLFASNCIILSLYFILIYTSTAFLSFLLGELILAKSKLDLNKYGWKVLAYLIGLAIIMVVYAIPFAGGAAMFAGILFGFGGIMMVIKDYIWGCCKKIKK